MRNRETRGPNDGYKIQAKENEAKQGTQMFKSITQENSSEI